MITDTGTPHGPWRILQTTDVYSDPWLHVKKDDVIRPEDLPPRMRETRQPQIEGPRGAIEIPDGLSLEDVEAIYIRRTMEQVEGNVSKAARRLGIGRSTLWRKLKRLGNH